MVERERFRQQRRDYTKESMGKRPAPQVAPKTILTPVSNHRATPTPLTTQSPVATPAAPPTVAATPIPLKVKRHLPSLKIASWQTTGPVILIIILAAGAWFFTHRDTSPVPKNIAASVSFPIYYPDTKKLPAGYKLDLSSFNSPQKNAVLYSVDYGVNKKVVFSVQPKASDSGIQTFYTNYIPLRTAYQTSVGTAEIGAYSNKDQLETLVSLPTSGSNTWLIITAPPDINQTQLKQVLNSLKKP